jgi:hypothetical protein
MARNVPKMDFAVASEQSRLGNGWVVFIVCTQSIWGI